MYNASDITLQSLIKTGEFYDIWNGKLKSRDNVTLDVVIKSGKGKTDHKSLLLLYVQRSLLNEFVVGSRSGLWHVPE